MGRPSINYTGAERERATNSDWIDRRCSKEKGPVTRTFSGAGDQIRTGDPHLGKVMLYH